MCRGRGPPQYLFALSDILEHRDTIVRNPYQYSAALVQRNRDDDLSDVGVPEDDELTAAVARQAIRTTRIEMMTDG